VLVYEVIVRKFFRPTIWANDIATMCYGAHFFLAGAYTLQLQKHIRTDFFSKSWSLKNQCGMDIAQYLLIFLPGMVMFTWMSLGVRAGVMGPQGSAHDDVAAARVLVQDRDPGELHPDPAAGPGRGAEVREDPARPASTTAPPPKSGEIT
jgi:hypothetical protein